MLNDKRVFVYVVDENHYIDRFENIYDVSDHIKNKFGEVASFAISVSSKTCIFLDDERIIGDVTWIDYPKYWIVKTTRTFDDFKSYVIDRLNSTYDKREAISLFDFSFDHDIQCYDNEGGEKTGYDCAKWLCDYCIDNKIDLDKLSYVVHSKNPVGSQNITQYIENAKRFQNENG